MEERRRESSEHSRNRSIFDSSNSSPERRRNKRRSKSRSRSRENRRRPSSSSNSYKKQHHKGDRHSGYKPEIFIPKTDGPLISFKEFFHLQPAESSVKYATLEKYYENYKKEHERDQVKIFFNEHKNDQWFIEKYDPIIGYQIYRNTLIDVERIANKFYDNLKAGFYDK